MYSLYVKFISYWFKILFHFLVNILFWLFSNKQSQNQVLKMLKNCPKKSLGKALFNCLNRHKLFIIPFFKTHDIKHILLGYKMTIIDEILMQCFMLGNGNKSPVSIGIAILGVHFPHLYKEMYTHYIEGTKAKNICKLNFHEIVQQQITQVRKVYEISIISKYNSYS